MALSFSPYSSSAPRTRGAGVTAVLGPTNTGKTHLAIERMLAHSSGMIGLPLRLLAREVYNKVAAAVGAEAVALVTGEEKIKPPNPRFWVSTVEAMPRDIDVAFLAIDEIQLGADFERGHVFTDRLLNRRGREETLVLGAATMRPLVERLLPGANILSRPRLSQLTYAGEKKLTRLPRRSAVVAFSAEEVYAIAELIRRQRGGAAVVLGALSPRTRNAQVALYQSGDVDYLVATDAIGMGLNLDVDHVAFAADRKFDGYQYRRLSPAELAQIAGRAGRAMRDGTFGTTGRCEPFEHDLVQALESHSFEAVKTLQWRNTDLDFSSIGALQAALSATPAEPGLTRAPVAEDIMVLEHASRDDEVRAAARSRAAVERLWDVCQVPDYRKVSPAAHAELAVTLFGFLVREGSIPADWFARQVAQADRTDGDIDTLSTRIAHIRTWTFAANRPDWLKDPEHWQEAARAVEDRLSDALHERLTERFVDRRTSILMRRLRDNDMLETEITKSGDVIVEGHAIGRLEGFRFAAESAAGGPDSKALRGAAQKVLASEIDQRAARLSTATNDQFTLAADGTLRWLGDATAKLIPGEDVLKPRLRLLADEQLTGASRDAVQTRLDLWIKAHIEKLLGPLVLLVNAEDVTGIARGVAFQLGEALGVLERNKVADEVKSLDQAARATLRKYGVRFGAYHIYMPALLKPAPRTLAAQLWALKHGGPDMKGIDELPHLAASGRTSFPVDKDVPKQLYRTVGYRVCGERAVRVDILERLADLIRPALAWRPSSPGPKPSGAFDGSAFTVTGAMTSLAGSSGEDFASILRSLGYRMEQRPKPPEDRAPAPIAADGGATPSVEAAPLIVPANDPAAFAEDAFGSAREPEAPAAQDLAAQNLAAQEPAAQSLVPDDIPPGEVSIHVSPDAVEPAPVEPEETAANLPAAAELAPEPASDSQAEPVLVEVWRPGRSEERRRRPRPFDRTKGEPRQQERHRAPREARIAVEAVKPGEQQSATAQAPQPAGRPARPEPPARERPERRTDKRQDSKGDQRGRGPRKPPRDRDRGGQRDQPREWRDPKDRRDKPMDPNSPFAKLAALKEQLEAHGKDRS